MINLVKNEEFQSIKTQLKSLSESELKTQNDPRMFGNGSVLDNYPPDRNTHFYENYMNMEDVKAGC